MMEKYDIGRKIGQGSFGSVHTAIHRDTGQTFVVKEIKTAKLSEREKLDVHQEVQLLSQLAHPNIVAYVESFRNVGSVYIVMEHCKGGDLYSLINRQRGRLLSEITILGYFAQLCHALQFVHDRKILHRDIKTQNIFLTTSRGKCGVVKLGDFGIARIMDGTHDYARTCIGTPYYLSPEVWEGKAYNAKSDLWACGCVLYELTSLKHAFEAGCMKNLIFKIIRGSYPPISSKYSYDIRNLIAALLRKRPEERPSPASMLRKGFISRAEYLTANAPERRGRRKQENAFLRPQMQREQKDNPKRARSANRVKPREESPKIRIKSDVKKQAVSNNDRMEENVRPEVFPCRKETNKKRQQLLQKLNRPKNDIVNPRLNVEKPVWWIDLSTPKISRVSSDTFTIEAGKIASQSAIKSSAQPMSSSGRILNVFRKISCFDKSSVRITEYLYEPMVDFKPEEVHGSDSVLTATTQVEQGDVSSQDISLVAEGADKLEQRRRVYSLPNIYLNEHNGSGGDEAFPVAEDNVRNIHAYLEQQRVLLEAQVGLEKLLHVYNLIANFEELDIEQVDYTDLKDILGEENQHLIDDIIQLVVADSFF